MTKLADQLNGTIKSLQRLNGVMNQLAGTTHHVAGTTRDTLAITNEVSRQHRRLRRHLPAAAQLLLLRIRTATTSPSAGRSGPSYDATRRRRQAQRRRSPT